MQNDYFEDYLFEVSSQKSRTFYSASPNMIVAFLNIRRISKVHEN